MDVFNEDLSIQNKKVVNCPKDQVDVIFLEKIPEEEARKNQSPE